MLAAAATAMVMSNISDLVSKLAIVIQQILSYVVTICANNYQRLKLENIRKEFMEI